MWPSNRTLLRFFLLSSAVCLSVLGISQDAFSNPPSIYRPKFRYWLPDASVPAQTVVKDIDSIAAAGGGGLEILPFYLYGLPGYEDGTIPPTDWSKYGFGTPAFSSLFKQSLQAVQKAGVVADFALGAAEGQGVPSKPGTPGLAVELRMGNVSVESGQRFSGHVPPPQLPNANILNSLGFMHALLPFGGNNLTNVIALQVLPGGHSSATVRTVRLDEDSFVDLTPHINNGTLNWTAPAGNSTWRIISFWQRYTNQRSTIGGVNATTVLGNGSWTVDHFSSAGASRVTDFWDKNLLSDDELARLLKTVGEYAWEDSMEIMATAWWTPGLLDRFQNATGYNLLKYLPLIFSSTNSWGASVPPYTEQYMYGNYTSDGDSVHNIAYRQVLNQGYQDYMSQFRDWTHSRGFKYSNQPAYNLPLEMLADEPLADAPEGESLGFSTSHSAAAAPGLGDVDAFRQFAGPPHLYNISVVSTEVGAVGVPAYSQFVTNLLWHIKQSFAGGFTMSVIHGYPYSGTYPNTTWPGYTTFFYEFTEMWNVLQPCWQHMKDVLDYVGRNQYALQQGVAKVDLAFYLYASPWSPKVQYNSTNLQDLGYTYNYLGPTNLMSEYATVQDKTLGYPAYKALVFYKQTRIPNEAADRLESLASAGLPIIFIGTPPNQTYPATAARQASLDATMAQLLSSPNVYQIASESALPTTLAKLGITPGTSLMCTSNPVYSLRRSDSTTKTDYIYFYNDQAKPVQCNTSISVSPGTTPIVLNAWTGTQEILPTFSTTNTTLTFPLTLQANETFLLALSATPSNTTKARTFTPARGIPVTNLTIWNLTLEDWHSAPNRSAIQTETTNHSIPNTPILPWKALANGAYANVSGVGHYTTTFTVPPSNSTIAAQLSLGLISHTVRAYLDGKILPPIDPVNAVVDISRLVRSGGTHEVRVEVTSPLFNRVRAEAEEVMVWGTVAGGKQAGYRRGVAQGYGLVGPVSVIYGSAG